MPMVFHARCIKTVGIMSLLAVSRQNAVIYIEFNSHFHEKFVCPRANLVTARFMYMLHVLYMYVQTLCTKVESGKANLS